MSALQALKHDPWFLDNHYRPQIEFLGAPVRVFRFEDGLDAVFDFVSAEMGIPCPAIIPHEKRSGGIAADLPWTPELIAAVHDAYEGVEDDPHRFMTITKKIPGWLPEGFTGLRPPVSHARVPARMRRN